MFFFFFLHLFPDFFLLALRNCIDIYEDITKVYNSVKKKLFCLVRMSTAKSNFWLFAFQDQLANVQTFTNGMELIDIDGSGDYKLLIADMKRKLRTYSGTSQLHETKLPSVPSALNAFFMPKVSLEVPVVAIAVGSTILMFSNEKPLYKFSVPPIPVDPDEQNIWDSLVSKTISVEEGVQLLDRRLEQGLVATSRTLDLLLLSSTEEREKFVETVKSSPLQQHDTVTCLSSLSFYEGERGDCLVLGTEHSLLYILDLNGTEVVLKVEVPSAPSMILTAGCVTSDYRIVVCCRHSQIYSIKNGLLSSHVIQPDASVCALTRYNNEIVVSTCANTVTYFSLKGKRHMSLFLNQPATNLATICDPATNEARGIVVGLSSGEFRVYVGRQLIHTTRVPAPIDAMVLGRYGREEAALVVALQNGILLVYFMHRNAMMQLQQGNADTRLIMETAESAEKFTTIPVPKLSSIFKAQTDREIAHAATTYRTFQYDLCHLRLLTAKQYLNALDPSCIGKGKSNENATVTLGCTPLQRSICVSSTVQGLGPAFKIRVELESLLGEALERILVVYQFDPSVYDSPRSLYPIPYLAARQKCSTSCVVRIRNGESGGAPIEVLVFSENFHVPLATMTVELPEQEFLEGF